MSVKDDVVKMKGRSLKCFREIIVYLCYFCFFKKGIEEEFMVGNFI